MVARRESHDLVKLPLPWRPPLDAAEELHAIAYQGVRASAIVELGSSSPFDQTADELGSAQVNDKFVLLDSPGETRPTCAAVNENTAMRRGHCRTTRRVNQEEP
jgi:hypothetical protein